MNNKIKKQLIFSAVYILISLIVVLTIVKNNYAHNYELFSSPKFNSEDISYVSEKMAFPASNHEMSINYSSPSSITISVIADGSILASCEAIANASDIATLSYSIPNATSNYQIRIDPSEPCEIEVYSVRITSDKYLNNDNYAKALFTFIVMMVGLAVLLCLFNGIFSMSQLFPIVILFFFSIFVSMPFLSDATMAGHDLGGLCGRIEGIKDALNDGQVYPTIFPKAYNGYGYLGFMYPEFFLLLPAFLRKINVSMTVSYHIFVFILNAATAYICYFCLRTILTKLSAENDTSSKIDAIALCSALFYLMAPYRLTDLYIRAALGEVMVMAFLPLVISGMYHIFVGDRKKWYQLVIGLSGILHAHILSCFMVLPLILIFTICYIKSLFKDLRWREIIYSVIAFFVINSWDIIPFIKYYRFGLNTDALTIVNTGFHAVPLSQLFALGIGYHEDVLVRTIGPASLIVLILFFTLIFERVYNDMTSEVVVKDSSWKFLYMCGGSFLLYLLLSVDIVPWNLLCTKFSIVKTIIQTVQFPFRFLMFVTVCLVFMMAIALLKSDLIQKLIMPITASIIILSIVSSGIIFDSFANRIESLNPYTGGFIANMTEEYLPAGTDTAIFGDINVYIDNGDITMDKNGTTTVVTYNSDKDTVASLPMLFYPCYKATDENGNIIEIVQLENKRMGLTLPSGSHTVTVRFKYL